MEWVRTHAEGAQRDSLDIAGGRVAQINERFSD